MVNDIDFRSMSFEEAWQFFKTESEMSDPSYKAARFGISIMFDINEYIMGYIRVKGKVGKVYIRDKAYSSEDFFTELELREKEIKNWLLDNFSQPDIATAWSDNGMIPSVQGGK